MSSAPEQSSHSELPPAVRIGHVNLGVADLDRDTRFYRDVLGFGVTAYGSDLGQKQLFLPPGTTTTT